MVFFSQGVRRWKGVSEEGGREWESCFNELSPGLEGEHLQRLEEAGAQRKAHRRGEQKSFQKEEAQSCPV